MGVDQEEATEEGGRTIQLKEVLLCGNTCGTVVWGRYVDVVGANGAEARGISCGVTETGEKVEGKKAEGRFMAEGGVRQSNSGGRDTTAPDILG